MHHASVHSYRPGGCELCRLLADMFTRVLDSIDLGLWFGRQVDAEPLPCGRGQSREHADLPQRSGGEGPQPRCVECSLVRLTSPHAADLHVRGIGTQVAGNPYHNLDHNLRLAPAPNPPRVADAPT
eukprot:COSAG01_NODE_6011_length_3902_cov_10.567447_3_plen_126_part_00